MSDIRKKIFLADNDQAIRMVGKNILDNDYDVYPIATSERLFELLGYVRPDLILLNVGMPDVDGFEAFRRLKESGKATEVPVIFLAGADDIDSEARGLALGAVDYIIKPFSAPLLLRRIETQLLCCEQASELCRINANVQGLVERQTGEVFRMQHSVLGTICELLEFRSNLMDGHVQRVKEYLSLLIDQLRAEDIYTDELKKWNLSYVLPAAQLHDVGKIAISDAILNKPDTLKAEEFEIVKTHVEVGVRTICQIEKAVQGHEFLHHAKVFAGTHHEHWNGKGYPYGLLKGEIPLEGRLLAIVDVYDALITEKPWKRAFGTDEAEMAILEGMGAQFDPALAGAFAEVSDQFAVIAADYRKAKGLDARHARHTLISAV